VKDQPLLIICGTQHSEKTWCWKLESYKLSLLHL